MLDFLPQPLYHCQNTQSWPGMASQSQLHPNHSFSISTNNSPETLAILCDFSELPDRERINLFNNVLFSKKVKFQCHIHQKFLQPVPNSNGIDCLAPIPKSFIFSLQSVSKSSHHSDFHRVQETSNHISCMFGRIHSLCENTYLLP